MGAQKIGRNHQNKAVQSNPPGEFFAGSGQEMPGLAPKRLGWRLVGSTIGKSALTTGKKAFTASCIGCLCSECFLVSKRARLVILSDRTANVFTCWASLPSWTARPDVRTVSVRRAKAASSSSVESFGLLSSRSAMRLRAFLPGVHQSPAERVEALRAVRNREAGAGT